MRVFVVIFVVLAAFSAFAAGKLHMKQGYTIQADEWWDDPAQGLLWYRQGTTRSAVTRSDVLRIEGQSVDAPMGPAPARPASARVVVDRATYTLTERGEYRWRWSVATDVQNDGGKRVRVTVNFAYVNYQGDTLDIQTYPITLDPGERRHIFGYHSMSASLAREVTNVRTSVIEEK